MLVTGTVNYMRIAFRVDVSLKTTTLAIAVRYVYPSRTSMVDAILVKFTFLQLLTEIGVND